jgi:hypothetical protein
MGDLATMSRDWHLSRVNHRIAAAFKFDSEERSVSWLIRELDLLREKVTRKKQRIAQLEDREHRAKKANLRSLPAGSEDIEAPPTGVGILKTLKGRGFIVTISCSNQYSRTTDDLLVDDPGCSSISCFFGLQIGTLTLTVAVLLAIA